MFYRADQTRTHRRRGQSRQWWRPAQRWEFTWSTLHYLSSTHTGLKMITLLVFERNGMRCQFKNFFWLVPADDEHQASWMQLMVSSFFSDSVLFKTREGRAGKVHNFMLGLNLNNDVPFSPFTETLSPVEEEVDAVTGQSSLFALVILPYLLNFDFAQILDVFRPVWVRSHLRAVRREKQEDPHCGQWFDLQPPFSLDPETSKRCRPHHLLWLLSPAEWLQSSI